MMSRNRAFYSVIQYCPDRFRAEAVNIGLLLFCEEPRFLRARISDNHRRLKRVFRVSGATLATIRLSEQNLLYRINERGEDIVTLDHLKGYVATRANDLRLTEPRQVVVADFEVDFARLSAQLVEDESTAVGSQMGHPPRAVYEAISGSEIAILRVEELVHRLKAELSAYWLGDRGCRREGQRGQPGKDVLQTPSPRAPDCARRCSGDFRDVGFLRSGPRSGERGYGLRRCFIRLLRPT